MIRSITLVIFNEKTLFKWNFGKKFSIEYTVDSLKKNKNKILQEDSEYILFWDANNGILSEKKINEIINSKGDLWHIGTKTGLDNFPYLLDFIQPTSMLNLSIEDTIDHSSWKHTFKGSLMKFKVFKEIQLSSYSNSLDIIGLDFGYKSIKSGVLTRYSHLFLNGKKEIANFSLKKKEELLFIRNNFDSKAFFWCYLLSFFKISPFTFFKVYKNKENNNENIFNQDASQKEVLNDKDLSVSIVIATLERYPFLENELEELRLLEIPVQEIIIIDQTPKEKRNKEFLNAFKDLPILYLETDVICQCTARNKGIEASKSKFVWFLDDDMEEIPSNYLEKHLRTIYSFDADISCGVPDEIGTNYVDRSISKIELSDGFPTNDVLVKRELLIEVDGFDVKMDQKQSEDEELGLRLIKNGALSVKNNQLRIVHLRASRGGLRNHNVRKVTFASSRDSLFQRRFLHHSEIYLKLKHFTKKQVYKSLLLNIRGTFIVRGKILKKSMKFFIGILLLPHSCYKIYSNYKNGLK
jgi:GT2 family glycosyltransferase